MSNYIKTVTILGADGKLGPTVLNALVAAEFDVTVLKRASSKSPSNYASNVKEIRLADDFNEDELIPALQGQDAIVVTIPGSQTEIQKNLADAAAKAGVKVFIPADFGSCDSQSARAQELVPLYVEKTRFREHLQALAKTTAKFTWTGLVCGHFFDWDMHFLHVNIRDRKADLLDNGEDRWSTCTLSQISKGVVSVLQKADTADIQNKLLYIQSFCVTQIQVVEAFEKATESKWSTQNFGSAEYTKRCKKLMDEGDKEAIEDMVWMLGTKEAYWEDKKDFANTTLELEQENLDGVVRRIVRDAS